MSSTRFKFSRIVCHTVQHAQLGIVQPAVRSVPGTVMIDEIPEEYRAQVDSMLLGELQTPGRTQSRARSTPGNRVLGRKRELVPQLQTARILRHAGTLFSADAFRPPGACAVPPRSAKLSRGFYHFRRTAGRRKSSFAPLPVRGGTGHRQIFRKIYRTLFRRRLARVHLGRNPFCRTVLPDRQVGTRFQRARFQTRPAPWIPVEI